MRLHGNPGTPEGRRLGGLLSAALQKKLPTGFILLRKVSFPRESTMLAELLGILAGDGHIGEYQVSVTTNSETDADHALYVRSLFQKLFKVPVSYATRKDSKACVVFVSSKEVSRFLVAKGMRRGHKIRGGVCMPAWVKTKKGYQTAFIKGLLDTDGCVYIDKHIIRGREYRNIGMAFTNRSLPLLADFKETLESYGFSPTQKTKYTVFLRRKEEIRRYFDFIGSSNPKHIRKVEAYFNS